MYLGEKAPRYTKNKVSMLQRKWERQFLGGEQLMKNEENSTGRLANNFVLTNGHQQLLYTQFLAKEVEISGYDWSGLGFFIRCRRK